MTAVKLRAPAVALGANEGEARTVKGTVVCLAFVGCAAPERAAIDGSSLLVSMQPGNQPAMVGALDFELLDSGVGKACVNRLTPTTYWVGMTDLAKLSADELTRQAIAAAATDAISRLDLSGLPTAADGGLPSTVDTILLTHVVTEGKGPDRVCATITGRGIHLVKAPTVPRPAEDAKPADQ